MMTYREALNRRLAEATTLPIETTKLVELWKLVAEDVPILLALLEKAEAHLEAERDFSLDGRCAAPEGGEK